LYCRMLEDTVKLIKGDIDKEPIETTVDIKIDAYIPSGYIKDETQKIEVYKKIASIDSYDYMMELQEELEDRFSDIPNTVYNLMNIAYLRTIARELGIIEIKEVNNDIVIIFENKGYLTPHLVRFILEKYKREIQFKMGDTPSMVYKVKGIKKEELLNTLINVSKEMNEVRMREGNS